MWGFDALGPTAATRFLMVDDLLIKPWIYRIDRRTESEEHSQGCQLPLHARGCEPISVPTFDAESMDVPSTKIIEIVDTVLFTPLDQLLDNDCYNGLSPIARGGRRPPVNTYNSHYESVLVSLDRRILLQTNS